MTTNEKVNLERLTTSLQKCRIHLQRIQYAVSQTEKLFPLEREIYQNLDDALIGNIDQLVFRYTKLQDEMGTNTFRYVLVYLQEDILDKPFRDILNSVVVSDNRQLTTFFNNQQPYGTSLKPTIGQKVSRSMFLLNFEFKSKH